MTYLLLFIEFFQVGLFAVGGGLATLPFLQKILERYPAWFGTLQLADIAAIAESTPGPIGVNAASFAGYFAAGIPGAIVTTIAIVLPSYLVILFVSRALEKYRDSKLVNNAFSGLRPAVTGLIAASGYAVLQSALVVGSFSGGFFAMFDYKSVLLFAVLVALLHLPKVKNLHPILFIVLGAVVGMIFSF